jgi:hypothetical protein
MNSPLIQTVIRAVLSELDRRDLIELNPGTSLLDLADQIAGTMSGAKPYAQFSDWLSDSLIKSDAVAELYATNEDLVDILRDVSP